MTAEKEFLSLEEVADFLDVNYQLVYKLVRSGEMPAVRIGRVYRVRRGQLDIYLRSHATGKGAASAVAMASKDACNFCGAPAEDRFSLRYKCKTCKARLCYKCWEDKNINHCIDHYDA